MCCPSNRVAALRHVIQVTCSHSEEAVLWGAHTLFPSLSCSPQFVGARRLGGEQRFCKNVPLQTLYYSFSPCEAK